MTDPIATVDLDEQGRPEPPRAAGELDTLLGFLEFQRHTLEWKTRGLDAAALRRALAPSTMTLGGLLHHLAWVEDFWFGYRLHGLEPAAEWVNADWSAHPDFEWTSAADTTPEVLRTRWTEAVGRSRRLTVAAHESPEGLDVLVKRPGADGAVSLRWILVHLIEEYSRHNGHADLLREAVDGSTGE